MGISSGSKPDKQGTTVDVYLMHRAISIKVMRIMAEGAFKPNAPALVSRSSGVMESCPWKMVREKSELFNRYAQTCSVHGMLVNAGGRQGNALQHCIQAIEQRLNSLNLVAEMCRRGMPIRGGHSGVRFVNAEEEPHPIAPMAAIPPSSSSSEEEFLMLPDSFQQFRLRIPRRILQSDVIVNFSVYLSEAEPVTPSWPSPAAASYQSNEIFLGDMQGGVYRVPRPLYATEHIGQPQQAQFQENLPQEESVQESLPINNNVQGRNGRQDSVHPREKGRLQEGEESVIWLDPPSHPI